MTILSGRPQAGRSRQLSAISRQPGQGLTGLLPSRSIVVGGLILPETPQGTILLMADGRWLMADGRWRRPMADG